MFKQAIENNEDPSEDNLFFQRDGVPPYYAAPVRQFFNQCFFDHRIDRRDPIG